MRRVLLASIAPVLASCSPYLYPEETKGFAAAVTDVRAAQASLAASAPEALDARDRATWHRLSAGRDGRPELVPSPNCSETRGGERCSVIRQADEEREKQARAAALAALQAAAQSADTAQPSDVVPSADPEPADACRRTQLTAGVAAAPPPPAARVTPADITAKLEAYGKALAAITNAKDREDFDAATSAAGTAAASLTGFVVGGPAGAAAGAVAKVVFDAARLGVAITSDHRRYKVLKSAVLNACASVRTLSAVLYTSLDGRRTAQIGAWNVALLDGLDFPVGRGRAAYDTLLRENQAIAARVEQLRRSDPGAVAMKIRTAHDALAVALDNDDERQIAAVAGNIAELADAARALREALARP